MDIRVADYAVTQMTRPATSAKVNMQNAGNTVVLAFTFNINNKNF